ncbi:MAG TPA: hypothetical protein PK054_08730 [Anaerohalosphaeraceae bacterium]|nr:hypothetical protein [Anaerohalosphaeraceae bacterium]HOL89113.1 hypothetical protein [Anaerohalosphaeraceae bacterium]HPP56653.1 hypothetical protein [Anaerohalosphaeraceae bacterium]
MNQLKWAVFLLGFFGGISFGGIAVLDVQKDEAFLKNMRMSGLLVSSGYTYSFIRGSRYITDGSDYQAVQNAFQKWTSANSYLWAVEVPSKGNFTPGRRNGRNEIAWISPTEKESNPWKNVLNLPDTILAVVKVWVESATNRVIERDLYFNDVTVSWRTGSDGDEGGFWVERVALHEIGHLFGLRDVYNPGQKGWEGWMGEGNELLTMYGYSSRWDETAAVHPVESAALAFVYFSVPEPRSMPVFALAAAMFFIPRRR